MENPDVIGILKQFVEELYFRAPCAQTTEERMAIKGVQHSLENALKQYGILNDFREDLDSKK